MQPLAVRLLAHSIDVATLSAGHRRRRQRVPWGLVGVAVVAVVWVLL